MCKILIFGGTTEGRRLAEFCSENQIHAYMSVATEYGGELLGQSDFLHILTGRRDAVEIADFITEHGIRLVLDATHPYAVEVGKNIAAACEQCGVKNIRILRESSDWEEYGHYFEDIPSLVDYLNLSPNGTVLITTGSKDLKQFCRIENYAERCMVRVLPAKGIVEKCAALGFSEENIIAEKGPFSEAQNIAHLRKFGAKYLVTKESGRAGGFGEKVSAAKQCGADLLVIRRPQESGISPEEAERILTEAANGTF